MKATQILIGILSVMFIFDSAMAPFLNIPFLYLLVTYLIAVAEITIISYAVNKIRIKKLKGGEEKR